MSEASPSAFPTNSWRPEGVATLFERYQILGVIGEGGMGTVFKGFHLNLKRFVAIKTLRIDRAAHPELVDRFLWEMQAVGQMDHPNVVRASDAGEKNGVCYLVMDYLTGADLSRLVTERGRLGQPEACELCRQAALGLEYIHRTLVHRDIKPSNLLLTTDGLVKILDLGLARLGEVGVGDRERTPEGCVLGTYAYMAPEQATAGTAIDGRADIYSLGCTLFKLLTGRAPFSGPEYDNAAKQLYAHCHVPLTAVEGFRAIPEDLGAVLLRMAAKAPAGRYATAREVAEALTPFAAGAEPLRLLGQTPGGEPAVHPLPSPLPEELSRLTAVPHETPAYTGKAPSTGRPAPAGRGRRPLLVAGLLAAVLAVLAWFVVSGLMDRSAERDGEARRPKKPDSLPGPGPRALDELAPHTLHRLLDQRPLPVGCAPNDVRKYRWDAGEYLLEVKAPDTLLFLLGTTTRPRFGLEAGITQAPWTGRVGLFWGYREDAARKAERQPGVEFAWYQTVCVWHDRGAKGEDRFAVRRGRGALTYNPRGEVVPNLAFQKQQQIPLPVGEIILQIEVEPKGLWRARFGAIDLSALCADEVNKAFRADPSPGGIGLLALSHSATFSNVRFLSRPPD
jgi:hypothetical protein